MTKKTQTPDSQIRLQKLIAKAGLASRRGAEAFIAAGRVTVNGKVVRELGTKADPENDVIEVDGSPLDLSRSATRPVTLLFNKPRGVICSANDPEGRDTIFDLLDKDLPRLFTVGRLDYTTEGAILLTNDGDLANQLTHPRHHTPKVYHAKVQGRLSQEDLKQLRNGVVLDGKPTLPADVVEIGAIERNIWYEITLFEGRNRQIHRMMEAVGLRVSRLKRVQIGNLTVDGLNVGTWREVTKGEIEGLLAGAPPVQPPGPPRPRRGVGNTKGPSLKRSGGFRGKGASGGRNSGSRSQGGNNRPRSNSPRRKKP